MSLTARGRALEDGAMSDTIRVENIQSQRKVSGTVTGPGVVVVEPNSVPTN
jgi:flagella basal body P-ring formation protein FlgA